MNAPKNILRHRGLILGGLALISVGVMVWLQLFGPRPTVQKPSVETPAISKEIILDVENLPEALRPYMFTWQEYVQKIQAGDETLTYAREIKLALSTAGENTWFIESEAGIYEDNKAKTLLMREMKGHLENVPASTVTTKNRDQLDKEGERQLELEAPFARYDAEKETITLQGRSRIILYK